MQANGGEARGGQSCLGQGKVTGPSVSMPSGEKERVFAAFFKFSFTISGLISEVMTNENV